MTLKELTPQLLALTAPEKTEAIQLLSQSLNPAWRGISKTSGVCGGNACIANTRIPVWVLIQAQRVGATESELLYDYPTLSAVDLVKAWAYAEAFSNEIEAAIQENDAVMQLDV
jgi:uncharacterized protein (DUF433 family)